MGKVLKNELRQRFERASPRQDPAPDQLNWTKTERLVSRIWARVLGVSSIGKDREFVELGGHSLLAIAITSKLKETFGVEHARRRIVRVFDDRTHGVIGGRPSSNTPRLGRGA